MAVTESNVLTSTQQGARQRIANYLQRKSVQHNLGMAFVYTVLTISAIVISIPLVWMVSTSLKDPTQVFTWPIEWLPNPIRWQNYPEALTIRPFGLWAGNSMITAGMSVLGHCLSATLVAFAFARLRWRGRDVLFLVMLSALMLPQEVTLIPQFLIFRQIGWVNTLYPLFIPPFFGGAFNIFIMRQFMVMLPRELDDAARMDGCNYFQILTRIIAPQVFPALGFIAINTFRNRWNDFFHPLIYLNDPQLFTLALGLRTFRGEYAIEWGYLMAASLAVMMPVMVMFFFTQRYFIQGMVFTGVKG